MPQVWLFNLLLIGIVVLKALVDVLIPDTVREVVLQEKRRDFLNSKIIFNVPDLDHSEAKCPTAAHGEDESKAGSAAAKEEVHVRPCWSADVTVEV